MSLLKKIGGQISAALLAAFLSLNNAEAQDASKGSSVPEYFAKFGKTEVVLDPQYGYITSLDDKISLEEKEKLFHCIDQTIKILRDVNLAVSGGGIIVYRDSKPNDDKRYTQGEGIYYSTPSQQLAFPCVQIEKRQVNARIENVKFTVRNTTQKQDYTVTIDEPGRIMDKESNVGIIEIDSADDKISFEINANIPLDKRITLFMGAKKIYSYDGILRKLPSLEETNFSPLEIIVATTKKDGKQFETLRLRINYSLSYIAEALTNLPEEKQSVILDRFAETSEDADLHYLLAEKIMEKNEQTNDSTRKVKESYEKALQKDAKRLFDIYENPKEDYIALIGKNPFMFYISQSDEHKSENYKKGQTDFFLVRMFENQWRTLYGKEIQDLVEEGPSLSVGMDNEEFMALLHNLAGMQAFDVSYISGEAEKAKAHFKKAYDLSMTEFFNTTDKDRKRQMKNLSQAYLANFYLVDLDRTGVGIDNPKKDKAVLRRIVKQITQAKEDKKALYSFLPDYGFLADYLLCIAYYKLGDDNLLYETFKGMQEKHRGKLFTNNNYGIVTGTLEWVKVIAEINKDFTISHEVNNYLPAPPLPQPPLP